MFWNRSLHFFLGEDILVELELKYLQLNGLPLLSVTWLLEIHKYIYLLHLAMAWSEFNWTQFCRSHCLLIFDWEDLRFVVLYGRLVMLFGMFWLKSTWRCHHPSLNGKELARSSISDGISLIVLVCSANHPQGSLMFELTS